MKRCLAIFIAIIILLLCGCSKKEKQYTSTRILLDTAVQITLLEGGNNKILSNCFKLCEEYESLLSVTDKESDIYRINAANGSPVEVSKQTAELLRLACDYSKASDGVFDITIYAVKQLWDFKADNPMLPSRDELSKAVLTVDYNNISINGNTVTVANGSKIDLGGIAKGYIADKIHDYLKTEKVDSAIINLGGNVCCVGKKTGGFKIGIKAPYTENKSLKTVQLDGGSVVTSGCYERYFTIEDKQYHHILDTATGYPIENDLASVTVISESSALADYLSTALYALGYEKGLEFLSTLPAEAVFVFKDNSIYLSDGLKDNGDTIVYR